VGFVVFYFLKNSDLFFLFLIFLGQQLSKRIEDLIERDYLERDEEDQRTLLYVP